MRHRLILLLLLIFFAATVFAQVSAPPRDQSQSAVLADMSRRTGETVTLNALSSQQWYYGTYGFITSLGCGAAPANPPTTGNWQRFVFNYRGLDYIYLISDNLQSLILCNEPSLPTAIPTTTAPTATLEGSGQSGSGIAQATATVQGSGQSGAGIAATATPSCALAPRLREGAWARVTPGDPNWLHAESTRNSEKIGEIPAGTSFAVLFGPVCDGVTGMNYWQVGYDGLIGWTSEGLAGEYWLEPYANTFQPNTVNEAFVPDWANSIPADSNALIALSPQNDLIALAINPRQVDIIRLVDNTAAANIILESDVTTLDFQVAGSYLTIGLANGEVHHIQVFPTVELVTIYQHEGAIRAVRATWENAVLAVADDAGILSFWSLGIADAPLRRIQLPEVAGSLEFSTDSRLLLVRDLEGAFLTALQVP